MTLVRPIDDRSLRRLSNGAGACAVAGMALLIWFQVYRPLVGRRASSREEISHLDDLWRERERIETAHLRHTAARDQAARDLDRWARSVPATTAEAELLDQLSAAAAELGLRLEEFRVDGVRTDAACPALEARTSVRASYHDLCRLLDRIEHLPRLCRIPRFRLDVDDAADAGHRVSLTLHAFFRPDASAESDPPPYRRGPS